MCPALPPPPPAIVKPVPSAKTPRAAENFGRRVVAGKTKEVHSGVKEWRVTSHAPNVTIRKKHTNRLHSRKQAKLRAKRKAR